MKNKTNILIPIAGRGQRFVDEGYVMPKQLIMVGDTQMIDLSLSSILNKDQCNLIFCLRRDHVNNYSLDKILKQKYGEDIKLIILDHVTRGSVETCLMAKDYINNDNPLMIYTLDVYFEDFFDPTDIEPDMDGTILTFKSNNNGYSYAKLNDEGFVTKTAEKEVISENAAVGVYTFGSGASFVKYAEQMIDQEIMTRGEFYICPLYNLMIKDGAKVNINEVDKMHLMGTPEELEFYLTHSLVKFGDKPIAICADHSGFDLKNEACKILTERGLRYVDYGTFVDKDCDYNDYVGQAIDALNRGFSDHVIAFCRTGQGVNIAGSKNKGVRAAVVYDEYAAEYSIKHNCANYFSVPSRVVDSFMLSNMVDIWQRTSFDGGRHIPRITKAEFNEKI